MTGRYSAIPKLRLRLPPVAISCGVAVTDGETRAVSPCHKGGYRSGDLYHCWELRYVCMVAEIILLTEWFFLRYSCPAAAILRANSRLPSSCLSTVTMLSSSLGSKTTAVSPSTIRSSTPPLQAATATPTLIASSRKGATAELGW